MSRMPNSILGEIVEASAKADAERAIAAAIRPLIARQERAPKRGAQPYPYLAHLRNQQQAHNREARRLDRHSLTLKAELADLREAMGMTVPPHLIEARECVRQDPLADRP